MRGDHLPDTIEIIPADPERFLTHVTLAAVGDGHGFAFFNKKL